MRTSDGYDVVPTDGRIIGWTAASMEVRDYFLRFGVVGPAEIATGSLRRQSSIYNVSPVDDKRHLLTTRKVVA